MKCTYTWPDNQYKYDLWPMATTGSNQWLTSLACPHCQAWIYNYVGFQYCPYCGKKLFDDLPKPKIDQVIEKLDEIKNLIEKLKQA